MALSTKSFAITPESSTTPTECELFQANPASFVFTLPTGQTFNGADVVRLELRAASTPGDDGLLARVSSSASPTGASVTLAFTSAQMNQAVDKTATDYALILYATEGDTHRTLWIGTLKLNADDSTASLTADPPAVTDIYLTSEAVAAVYATIATVGAIDDRVTALESGGATDAVLYTAQTLDAGQKEQAATNIGLGVDDDVTHNSLTLSGGVDVATELSDNASAISSVSSSVGSLSTSKMDKSSNLSDLTSASTARANLGVAAKDREAINPSSIGATTGVGSITLSNEANIIAKDTDGTTVQARLAYLNAYTCWVFRNSGSGFSNVYGAGAYFGNLTITDASSGFGIGLHGTFISSKGTANKVCLANGASAQTFEIYATDTSSTVYERLSSKYDSGSGAFVIGTEKGASGGSARDLIIRRDGDATLTVNSSGIKIKTAGHIADNGGTLSIGFGDVGAGYPAIRFGGSVFLFSDHIMCLGGNSSSFPAIKRDGTTLVSRLGDDSADAPLRASRLNLSNLPTSAAGLSAGDIWNDSGTLKIA